jgi:hypothetical protein
VADYLVGTGSDVDWRSSPSNSKLCHWFVHRSIQPTGRDYRSCATRAKAYVAVSSDR